jgi:hypothetical protein
MLLVVALLFGRNLHSAALSLVATLLDDHAASKCPSLARPASGRGLARPVIMTPAAGPTGRDPAGPGPCCSPAPGRPAGGPAPSLREHCQRRGRRRARPREGGCQFLRCRPLPVAIGTPALILSHATRVGIPASQPENRGPSQKPPSESRCLRALWVLQLAK